MKETESTGFKLVTNKFKYKGFHSEPGRNGKYLDIEVLVLREEGEGSKAFLNLHNGPATSPDWENPQVWAHGAEDKPALENLAYMLERAAKVLRNGLKELE
jgi:hypothetical protein